MATNFTKVGDEVQVNLAPNLNNDQSDPDVTALTDGRFFVVFEDFEGNNNIIGQFVNADGTLSGGNISLDLLADANNEFSPAVAARAGGGAIVVWDDSTDSNEIEFATVSSAGVVSGELNVLTGDPLSDPDVAVLADGRALVVAESFDGTDDNIVFNFINAAADGTTGQGVIDDSDEDEFDPAVAAFGNNALVVYREDTGDAQDIKARFYNGTSFAAEVTIDGAVADAFEPAVAALADGRFIVVWEEGGTDTLKARFVGADGTPEGSAFTLVDAPGDHFGAAVAGLPDGGFVVTWDNDGSLFPGEESSDTTESVLGQRFDATGAAAGDIFLVHAGDPEDQENSAVAVNASGQSFVVFQDSATRPGDGDPDGIRGQAFVTTTDPVNGSAGSDLIEASALSETISGLDGNDNIFALGGNDIVDGGPGKDMVSGGDGNDTISGGLGHDLLQGDAGADNFLFNTAIKPKGSNVDTIVDYSAAEDTIVLDDAIFTKLKAGALKEKAFRQDNEAEDKNDRIVYDDKSGDLIYDKNGKKSGGEVVFAHLDPKLDLSAADFLVV